MGYHISVSRYGFACISVNPDTKLYFAVLVIKILTIQGIQDLPIIWTLAQFADQLWDIGLSAF